MNHRFEHDDDDHTDRAKAYATPITFAHRAMADRSFPNLPPWISQSPARNNAELTHFAMCDIFTGGLHTLTPERRSRGPEAIHGRVALASLPALPVVMDRVGEHHAVCAFPDLSIKLASFPQSRG